MKSKPKHTKSASKNIPQTVFTSDASQNLSTIHSPLSSARKRDNDKAQMIKDFTKKIKAGWSPEDIFDSFKDTKEKDISMKRTKSSRGIPQTKSENLLNPSRYVHIRGPRRKSEPHERINRHSAVIRRKSEPIKRIDPPSVVELSCANMRRKSMSFRNESTINDTISTLTNEGKKIPDFLGEFIVVAEKHKKFQRRASLTSNGSGSVSISNTTLSTLTQDIAEKHKKFKRRTSFESNRSGGVSISNTTLSTLTQESKVPESSEEILAAILKARNFFEGRQKNDKMNRRATIPSENAMKREGNGCNFLKKNATPDNRAVENVKLPDPKFQEKKILEERKKEERIKTSGKVPLQNVIKGASNNCEIVQKNIPADKRTGEDITLPIATSQEKKKIEGRQEDERIKTPGKASSQNVINNCGNKEKSEGSASSNKVQKSKQNNTKVENHPRKMKEERPSKDESSMSNKSSGSKSSSSNKSSSGSKSSSSNESSSGSKSNSSNKSSGSKSKNSKSEKNEKCKIVQKSAPPPDKITVENVTLPVATLQDKKIIEGRQKEERIKSSAKVPSQNAINNCGDQEKLVGPAPSNKTSQSKQKNMKVEQHKKKAKEEKSSREGSSLSTKSSGSKSKNSKPEKNEKCKIVQKNILPDKISVENTSLPNATMQEKKMLEGGRPKEGKIKSSSKTPSNNTIKGAGKNYKNIQQNASPDGTTLENINLVMEKSKLHKRSFHMRQREGLRESRATSKVIASNEKSYSSKEKRRSGKHQKHNEDERKRGKHKSRVNKGSKKKDNERKTNNRKE